jgi:hypothetical protein
MTWCCLPHRELELELLLLLWLLWLLLFLDLLLFPGLLLLLFIVPSLLVGKQRRLHGVPHQALLLLLQARDCIKALLRCACGYVDHALAVWPDTT